MTKLRKHFTKKKAYVWWGMPKVSGFRYLRQETRECIIYINLNNTVLQHQHSRDWGEEDRGLKV